MRPLCLPSTAVSRRPRSASRLSPPILCSTLLIRRTRPPAPHLCVLDADVMRTQCCPWCGICGRCRLQSHVARWMPLSLAIRDSRALYPNSAQGRSLRARPHTCLAEFVCSAPASAAWAYLRQHRCQHPITSRTREAQVLAERRATLYPQAPALLDSPPSRTLPAR
ncbi:hypothetical protein DFH06DRAFT_449030 [Mycena polygramma]|nr:hypothetical protein DFH06DRAFT_449030 [Mycena polygramma]